MVLRAPSGEPLAEAWVDPGALAAARARWRRTYLATVIAAAGVTVLLFIGPLLDRRIGATERVYLNCHGGRVCARLRRRVCSCGWRSPWPRAARQPRR